jgi:hypothetical protein
MCVRSQSHMCTCVFGRLQLVLLLAQANGCAGSSCAVLVGASRAQCRMFVVWWVVIAQGLAWLASQLFHVHG